MPEQAPIVHTHLPLIETADKSLLDMFFADPATRPFLTARLSDTVAVIQPDKFDVLLNRMKKLGHTPKILDR
jgi:hypothetical protein